MIARPTPSGTQRSSDPAFISTEPASVVPSSTVDRHRAGVGLDRQIGCRCARQLDRRCFAAFISASKVAEHWSSVSSRRLGTRRSPRPSRSSVGSVGRVTSQLLAASPNAEDEKLSLATRRAGCRRRRLDDRLAVARVAGFDRPVRPDRRSTTLSSPQFRFEVDLGGSAPKRHPRLTVSSVSPPHPKRTRRGSRPRACRPCRRRRAPARTVAMTANCVRAAMTARPMTMMTDRPEAPQLRARPHRGRWPGLDRRARRPRR